MKIAMPNEGSKINQHFGKSKSFVILTIEQGLVTEVLEIPTENYAHQHETLADFIVAHGVSVVVTGGIGPGAMEKLKEKQLQIITGATGEYMDIARSFIEGTLEDKNISCGGHGEDHHHGKGHHH